jgi:hypothetical protein
MLSALALSGYVIPPPALLTGLQLGHEDGAGGAAVKLAGLPRKQAAFRAAIKAQKGKFRELLRQVEQLESNPDELDDLANAVYASEQEIAREMVPKMELLGDQLAVLKRVQPKPQARAIRRHMEEWLDNAATWLELYQNLRIMLIKLASDRRSLTEPGSDVFSSAEDADAHLRSLMAE